ncbi:MAG: RnfABCDGE type electron transport complex subunit B [Burkholderiaceae bacterium]|nr:RnfABCDGE type electron transport complex subunit B [Burkholderiaceae bacterium]
MSAAKQSLIESINELLPQTQCQRCGYKACLPYAQAIALENEAINRCPPGGHGGIEKLAQVTGRPVLALDESCGTEEPLQLAVIDAQRCIGCALCLEACPVDAITGAFKFMHAVIESDCTGCELCLPSCPVDCIQMVSPEPQIPWTEHRAAQARRHFERREQRLKETIRKPGSKLRQQLPVDKEGLLKNALARAKARQEPAQLKPKPR